MYFVCLRNFTFNNTLKRQTWYSRLSLLVLATAIHLFSVEKWHFWFSAKHCNVILLFFHFKVCHMILFSFKHIFPLFCYFNYWIIDETKKAENLVPSSCPVNSNFNWLKFGFLRLEIPSRFRLSELSYLWPISVIQKRLPRFSAWLSFTTMNDASIQLSRKSFLQK